MQVRKSSVFLYRAYFISGKVGGNKAVNSVRVERKHPGGDSNGP